MSFQGAGSCLPVATVLTRPKAAMELSAVGRQGQHCEVWSRTRYLDIFSVPLYRMSYFSTLRSPFVGQAAHRYLTLSRGFSGQGQGPVMLSQLIRGW